MTADERKGGGWGNKAKREKRKTGGGERESFRERVGEDRVKGGAR